jgi:hypothetical protein
VGQGRRPVVWQWQQRARTILTREFFQREYIQAGKTFRQLAAETGFPRKFLASCAREHGITVTTAFDPASIDMGWLREQYITRQRSYTGIAAELGVQDVTVIAAARRYGIPSRPRGVHSRPEMITRLSADMPRDIRRAVEGGLKGWHRLLRFQAAMTFPTIEAAETSIHPAIPAASSCHAAPQLAAASELPLRLGREFRDMRSSVSSSPRAR